jgi:hypothetical protein
MKLSWFVRDYNRIVGPDRRGDQPSLAVRRLPAPRG